MKVNAASKWPILKWHRLRRQRDDSAFNRENLAIGARCGASMEVDLRAIKTQEFLCLHDATCERETNGQGHVADLRLAEARQLLMRDETGTVTTHHPLLFGELVEKMRHADVGALMQLDFKDDIHRLSAGHLDFFRESLTHCAERFVLSCDNVAGMRLLAKNLSQLKLGYDPCTQDALSKLGDPSSFVHFAKNTIAAMPEAAYIYLEYPVILAGLDVGVNVVEIFHEQNMKVDAYTLNSSHPHMTTTREQFLKSVKRFSDKNCGKNKELEQFVEPSEVKTALERLICAGVDQITTDEATLLESMLSNRAHDDVEKVPSNQG